MNSSYSDRNRGPAFDEPTRNELRQSDTNVETQERSTPAPSTQDSQIARSQQPIQSSINRKGIEANIATEGVSTPDNRIGPNIKSLNAPVTQISQSMQTKPSTEVKNSPAEAPEALGKKDNTQNVTMKGPQEVATSLLEFPRGNIGSLFTRPDRTDLIPNKPMRNMYQKKVEENTEIQTSKLMQ